MKNRLHVMVMLLLPVMAQAESTHLLAGVQRLLTARGVTSPVTVSVPDRQVRSEPELLVRNAQLVDRTLILLVGCRTRVQCGDVVATVLFDSIDQARIARVKLSTSLLKQDNTPVVRAGQSIRLIMRSQGLKLELPAKALSSGALLQRIRVRDPNTRKIYHAVVVSPTEVSVPL